MNKKSPAAASNWRKALRGFVDYCMSLDMLAVDPLAVQVGQSRCDVVRMGRLHVRSGTLSLQRQKTGVPFDVSVMPTLQQAIDAMPASDHLTFLATAQGKPFSAAGFGNWFREICDAAGLPKRCISHGLRKAAATRLADRGATTTELKAWFGWKTDSEAERYTRNADRKSAAARERARKGLTLSAAAPVVRWPIAPGRFRTAAYESSGIGLSGRP